MTTSKSPKQVKVHVDGCTPDTLTLFKDQDEVVFVQGGPKAPTTVHVDNPALFGTTTCVVGHSAEDAKVYTAQAQGNFLIGLTQASLKSGGGKGIIQVLCLAPTTAKGTTGTGSVKVTG